MTVFNEARKDMCIALNGLKIPYEVITAYDGCKFTFPWCNGDVICHSGSYGGWLGLWESYNFPWDEDDVTGNMDMLSFIAKLLPYYIEKMG